MSEHDALDRRLRLERAVLCLVFTPHLCEGRDPLAVLEAALPHVDLVQVRPKRSDRDLEATASLPELAQTSARELFDWTLRILDLLRAGGHRPLLIVNDRPDVARTLSEDGVDGVHVGQDDSPPGLVRDLLGSEMLIGLSTHSQVQVLSTLDEPIDYLGFGPLHPTRTKGYERGLGVEAAWVAHSSAVRPLFPIGGITLTNAGELEPIGRAAVSSAILAAPDPGAAARILKALLQERVEG